MADFLMFTSSILIAVGIFLVLAHRANPNWWREDEPGTPPPRDPPPPS